MRIYSIALNPVIRIYGEYKNTESKYKTRIRSRYSNLKDSRNPELRAAVLTGQITPDKIAVMTAEVNWFPVYTCTKRAHTTEKKHPLQNTDMCK